MTTTAMVGGRPGAMPIIGVSRTTLVVPRRVIVVLSVKIHRLIDIANRRLLFHFEVKVLVFGDPLGRIDSRGFVINLSVTQSQCGDMPSGGSQVRMSFRD